MTLAALVERDEPSIDGDEFRTGARIVASGGLPLYISKPLVGVTIGSAAIQVKPVVGRVLTLVYASLAPVERRERGKYLFPSVTLLENDEWRVWLYTSAAEHAAIMSAIARAEGREQSGAETDADHTTNSMRSPDPE